MKTLSKELILKMHDQMLDQTGGIHGVRDMGLLDSAISAPYQSFGDTDLYPTVIQKAARLGYGLVNNHAFLDGNKRTGAHVMLVLLFLNNIPIEYTQKELEDIILDIAASRKGYDDLLQWVIIHRVEKITE